MDNFNKTLVDNWVRVGKIGGLEKKSERGCGCISGGLAYETVYQSAYTFVYQKFVRKTQTIKPVQEYPSGASKPSVSLSDAWSVPLPTLKQSRLLCGLKP